MSSTQERVFAEVVDVSMAANSAEALDIVYVAAKRLAQQPSGTLAAPVSHVDLNAGNLVLTPHVLAKMRHYLATLGIELRTVFAVLPQTQQAALDEGLYVREIPEQLIESLRQTPVNPDFEPDKLRFLSEDNRWESLRVATTTTASQPKQQPSAPATSSEAIHMVSSPTKISKAQKASLPPKLAATQHELAGLKTLYFKQNLRSGQVLRHEGHVVVIGDAHAGSEITAHGDIVVWGELKGIAHAGANGDLQAEIRALKIEALQLRIADTLARRPDRIFYHKELEQQQVLGGTELARVVNGEIKIFRETLKNSR